MQYQERKIGIEVEVESNSVPMQNVRTLLTGPMSSGLWELDDDGEGSLRAGEYGWEIRTAGQGQSLAAVRSSMHELYPILSSSSGIWRAAVHTHVSLAALKPSARANLLALVYCVDDDLFEKFSPERRESNFCVPLANDTARTMQALSDYKEGLVPQVWCKYTSLNVLAERTFDTFEFRHMKTPAAGTSVSDIRTALLKIWDFANTCSKLVDYVYRCTGAEIGLAKMLSPELVLTGTGLVVDAEAAYRIIEHVGSDRELSSVDTDLPTLFRATNPEGRRPTAVEQRREAREVSLRGYAQQDIAFNELGEVDDELSRAAYHSRTRTPPYVIEGLQGITSSSTVNVEAGGWYDPVPAGTIRAVAPEDRAPQPSDPVVHTVIEDLLANPPTSEQSYQEWQQAQQLIAREERRLARQEEEEV